MPFPVLIKIHVFGNFIEFEFEFYIRVFDSLFDPISWAYRGQAAQSRSWPIHKPIHTSAARAAAHACPVNIINKIWTIAPIRLLQLSIQNKIWTTATRWLGHQCCKDLLTQDHLSLWTVETNWGVWLVHSNQAMDNCQLLIVSSVFQWVLLHITVSVTVWTTGPIGLLQLSIQNKIWTTATRWVISVAETCSHRITSVFEQ